MTIPAYKDYYQLLGVTKPASPKEIRSAYRDLARTYHPDVNPGNKEAAARFQEIHEAYASVAVAILRELPRQLDGFQVPDVRLNPNGGAVAIGHPFGSSGTRYVLTLATELRVREALQDMIDAQSQPPE